MTKTPSFRLAAFVVLALASGSALAQTGSLSYGPDSAIPVPLGSPLTLAIVAVILTGLAAWRLRRHPVLRVFAVIAQRITALTPPCENSLQFAAGACEAGGTLLASGQSCDTDFRCPAVTEICDGLDNDFNGLIDDGVTEPEASCPDGQSWACTGIGGWVCQGITPDCSGKVCGDDGTGYFLRLGTRR